MGRLYLQRHLIVCRPERSVIFLFRLGHGTQRLNSKPNYVYTYLIIRSATTTSRIIIVTLQNVKVLNPSQLWHCLRLQPPASFFTTTPNTTVTSLINSTHFSEPHHQSQVLSYIVNPYSNPPIPVTLAHPTFLSKDSSNAKLQSLNQPSNHHSHPHRIVNSA